MQESESTIEITVKVNGEQYTRRVEPRLLLSDFLRHTLGLTGTHVGCEHGVCGACTIMVDGSSVRACLMLAVQADGSEIGTVEGLARDGRLDPLQEAFADLGGAPMGGAWFQTTTRPGHSGWIIGARRSGDKRIALPNADEVS